ncbi:hypothetical protein IAG41_00020 [Sphingomonas sp. JC676]|uniref:hypothetical protein n=1 Tax=Sphingomonas sp. JC676 TaxID=2768065 RepID=UPI0016581BB5|nr:hypothetical protein [Sphingomonas sp. JC676]MBC9030766.1 hypothetical protein [Sphingomonas sp. JC676]
MFFLREFAILPAALGLPVFGTANSAVAHHQDKPKNQATPHQNDVSVSVLLRSDFHPAGDAELKNLLPLVAVRPKSDAPFHETNFVIIFRRDGTTIRTDMEIVPTTTYGKWKVSGGKLCISQSQATLCRVAYLSNSGRAIALASDENTSGTARIYDLIAAK